MGSPSFDVKDLSKQVTVEPVSIKNGNSSPLSNRTVTNNQFPRPASLFMLTSGGNSEAGTMAEGCGRVSQAHNTSNGKAMPHLPSIFTATNLRADILAKSSAQSIITGSHESTIVDQNGEVGTRRFGDELHARNLRRTYMPSNDRLTLPGCTARILHPTP